MNVFIFVLFCIACLSTPINGLNKNICALASTAKIESEFEKFLYVDISLFSFDETLFPVISYKDPAEAVIFLDEIGNGIYVSATKIPNQVLSDLNYGFEISFINESKTKQLSSIWVSGGSALRNKEYNYICLSAFINSEGFVDVDSFGIYAEKKKNPGATYETQRIWISDVDDGGTYAFKCSWAAAYEKDGDVSIVGMPYLVNPNDGMRYYYADFPFEITSIRFLKMANDEIHRYSVYLDKLIKNISYGGCYAVNNEEVVTKKTTGADAFMLGCVVEAFLTFGTAPSNGATKETIVNVYATWFANKFATENDLKAARILDYSGYAANGNSYIGLTKTLSYSVHEKWNGLCSRAGVDPSTGELKKNWFDSLFNGSASVWTIMVVSALLMAALLSFSLIANNLKKRR